VSVRQSRRQHGCQLFELPRHEVIDALLFAFQDFVLDRRGLLSADEERQEKAEKHFTLR
jgi:hypothetical protein